MKALAGVESIKRYFLTSLHCFIVRKTSMNAAAPPDCCVSMTAQLVMYYNSTQLNSTQLLQLVMSPGHYASYANPISVCDVNVSINGFYCERKDRAWPIGEREVLHVM